MVNNTGFILECTATVGASDAVGTIDVVSMKQTQQFQVLQNYKFR